MTLETEETSAFGGSPIEFFKYTYGGTNILQVGSSVDTIGPLGALYTNTFVTRDLTNSTSELNKNPIELVVEQSNDVVQYFKTGQPDDILFLSIFRKHTTDVDSEFILIWQGRVTNCQLDGNYAQLICEPVSNSMRRLGIRAKYQKLCRHALYDGLCNAVPIQEPISIATASGTNIVVTGITQPDGFYTGGNLILTASNSMRMITDQVGNNLQISHPFNNIEAGLAGTAVAGCNHTRTQCNDKFNNIENYGGFPYIPTKNPFTDGPINQ